MKKESVTYILKHKPSGFYLKDKTGHEFTTNRNQAREWKENHKPDEEYWQPLIESNEYVPVKRTETTEIKYEEVPLNE